MCIETNPSISYQFDKLTVFMPVFSVIFCAFGFNWKPCQEPSACFNMISNTLCGTLEFALDYW